MENWGRGEKSDAEEFVTVISKDSKDGKAVYEKLPMKTPTFTGGIPDAVWKAMFEDLDSLPESPEPMKYKMEDQVLISINSDKKVLYQIIEAQKGHYVLGRQDEPEGTPREAVSHALFSKDPRNVANPLLITCSQSELDDWLQK